VPDDKKQDDDKSPATETEAPPEAAEKEPAAAEAADATADEDRFQPGAIASRVAGLGEESEADRIAREEEEKLRQRRKAKKGKKGLESAASKRLAKIGETKVKRPTAAGDLTPEADPLILRTAAARKWVQQNRQTFTTLVAVAVLGLGGFLGYTYWQGKHEAEASAMLAQGIADEHGQINDKDDEDDSDKKTSLYPTFKTTTERREAALAKYRQVESKFSGTGAAMLARLAEAGLLLDAGDAKSAAAAYEDVKGSALALADAQVRGRAIEGIGFADELLAKSDAASRDKHLDDALVAFKQLEGVDSKGLKELGKYHQARVLQTKGDRDKATALLKEVYATISEPGATHTYEYLDAVVEDRLRQLDPSALPPKTPPKLAHGGMPAGPGGGPPGGQGEEPDMNDPRIQEILRQLQEQQGQQPGGGGGKAPAPVPSP
jgi:hypothetical protein